MSRIPRARPSTSGALPRYRRTATSCCALAVVSPFALEYVVQPGDTVSELAAEHGTTVGRVVGANDLRAGGDRIYAGEVLRLPAAHPRRHGNRAHGAGTGAGAGAGAADRAHRAGTAAAAQANNAAGNASDAADDGRRRIEWHRVRPGDTMTGIAERYHAWTDELIAANGGGDTLVVGERIKVPVVVAAARAADHRDRSGQSAQAGNGSGRSGADARADDPTSVAPARVARLRGRLGGYPDPGRARVRRIITHVARREGVDPDLALAVSWQEAGWQQHHVSPDAAIGAMQVIPTTGAWADAVVGRDLDLMAVRDNVTAGVVLLAELTDAAPTRRAVAGYYQGLAGVRRHGMYDDTRAYVGNVMALKRAFERGDYPG